MSTRRKQRSTFQELETVLGHDNVVAVGAS
jgi:hypothetical protein